MRARSGYDASPRELVAAVLVAGILRGVVGVVAPVNVVIYSGIEGG